MDTITDDFVKEFQNFILRKKHKKISKARTWQFLELVAFATALKFDLFINSL